MIIHEIASKKITPLVKALIAHELIKNGYSQRRVANLLGVTQPQIHKYLDQTIEEIYYRIEKLGLNVENVSHMVKILVSTVSKDKLDKFILMLNALVDALTRTYVCRELSNVFNIYCVKKGFVDIYIEEYRIFLDRIVAKNCIDRIIPEVGSNIVYSPDGAKELSGVIGLTGRIIKTKIGVTVVGEPMYGGSRHLAKLLLIAREFNPDKRVAMNIVELTKPHGLDRVYNVVQTGPHVDLEDFWVKVYEALRVKPDVLIDRGGVGLEPITYIFTKDFNELEEMIDYILSKACRT